MLSFRKKAVMPDRADILPGRGTPMSVQERHAANGNRVTPPFPAGLDNPWGKLLRDHPLWRLQCERRIVCFRRVALHWDRRLRQLQHLLHLFQSMTPDVQILCLAIAPPQQHKLLRFRFARLRDRKAVIADLRNRVLLVPPP